MLQRFGYLTTVDILYLLYLVRCHLQHVQILQTRQLSRHRPNLVVVCLSIPVLR
jgi:hypothetical protein